MGFDSAYAAPPPAALAPGFRFHPTDEELVWYYLKRKISGRAFRFDAINEIDVYKSEPWDLPGKSRLKSRDLEWYFFSVLDKKYGNGWRTNRATEKGYWKTTGKDRPVLHNSRTVGMKKTLVYHRGRAPRGERTNWVMHEYKLVDEELGKSQVGKDAFVLCRIFQKSGSGPKNGEQYGAPFIEEDWEDDELVMIPGEETAEEVAVGADAYLDDNDVYLDGNDIEQILGADIPPEDVPLPLSFYYEDNTGSTEERLDFVNDDQKLLADAGIHYHTPDQPDAQILFNLPVENGMFTRPVKREYIGEPSNTLNDVDADYLVDEPLLGAIGNTASDDGASVEANDLSNPFEADQSSFDMLEDYLAYFTENDDSSRFIAFDSSTMLESENTVTEQAFLTQKCNDGGAQQEAMGRQQLVQRHDNNVPSTSEQGPGDSGLDIKYPSVKQASCMLGSIPAPAAFASEFPQKDAAFQSNSTSHSSGPIHVTAGMIQITDLTSSSDGTHWPLGKNMGLSSIISYNVPYNDVDYAFLDGKAGSTMSRVWFYLIFIWVLILSISLKIGTCVYSGNSS